MLNVFDPTAADQEVARNAARDLPAGFTDSLQASWDYVANFRAFEAEGAARSSALSAYGDDIYAKTGERLNTLGLADGLVSLDDFNAEQAKLKEKYPGLDYLAPLSDQDITSMTGARMAKARSGWVALEQREKTWGGSFGSFLGRAAEGVAGVQALQLPLAGAGELGIAGNALLFAAIGAGSEALNAVGSGAARERAAPGSSAEIPGDIAMAGASGAVLGGAFGALAKWLGVGARVLPTSLRDDANAAASELQFGADNIFPTAAGEAAHRDGIISTVTAMTRGEQPRAGEAFDPVHVEQFAKSVGAETMDATAEAAERARRPLTFGEQPDVERFERMPAETDDTASYWDARVEAASPEERTALGATDVPAVREQELFASPETYEAGQRNLDRLRLESPDMDYHEDVTLPDGSTQTRTRKLEDVLDEIDGYDRAGREMQACAMGMEAAE